MLLKIRQETRKIKHFWTTTLGHLNRQFVSAMGHLPVNFQKILIPGARSGGGGGGGWVMLELTDALLRKYQKIYTYSCDLSVMSRKPEAWKFYNIDWDSCIGRHKRPPCYISWCNCINHIFSLFLSGYKECSDTGIKQASKWEREIIN